MNTNEKNIKAVIEAGEIDTETQKRMRKAGTMSGYARIGDSSWGKKMAKLRWSKENAMREWKQGTGTIIKAHDEISL
jgi:hypothetical protein